MLSKAKHLCLFSVWWIDPDLIRDSSLRSESHYAMAYRSGIDRESPSPLVGSPCRTRVLYGNHQRATDERGFSGTIQCESRGLLQAFPETLWREVRCNSVARIAQAFSFVIRQRSHL